MDPRLLQRADLDTDAARVCFPDQLRAVEVVIGPSERWIVLSPAQLLTGSPQPRDPRRRENRLGIAQPLHDEVAPHAAIDPLGQRCVPHRRHGLQDKGATVAIEDEPHVVVRRVRGVLDRQALR